jgi:hypothetical protein
MRHHSRLFIAALLLGLTACSRTIEIADHDAAGLTAAIRQANTSGRKTTLRLARHGMYVVHDAAEAGLVLPSVRGKLTIEGNGAEIRAYTGEKVALLQVERGGELRIEKLSLAEGSEGAVRNYGELALDKVRITDSFARRAIAIVLNHGKLRARDSEIAYNTLAVAQRDAGTVLNYGKIELDRTAIHDNRALGKYPSLAVAGGVLNYGSLQVDGLRLADNDADNGGELLSAVGILNIGNGRVSGDIGADAIRETMPVAVLAR